MSRGKFDPAFRKPWSAQSTGNLMPLKGVRTMGIVRVKGPSSSTRKRAKGPTGICRICHRKVTNARRVRGKEYIDGDGVKHRAEDTLYHRECYRMQNRGLLRTGPVSPTQDSTGKPCGGCHQILDADAKYAHRNGVPYHKECLF